MKGMKSGLFIAVLVLALSSLSCATLTGGDSTQPTEPPPSTQAPAPTQAPPASPTPSALLQDDFSDPGSGWEVGDYTGGSVGYADGAYFVRASDPGKVMWGIAGRNFSAVWIEVDATQISAPSNDNNAYGVMCHVQSNDDGYVLQISGDGAYAIHRVVEGSFEPLVDWAASDAIRQGNATNHIRAACSEGTLTLFANGEMLTMAEDATYSSGDIAFAATTFEDQPTEIHFDNVVVTAP